MNGLILSASKGTLEKRKESRIVAAAELNPKSKLQRRRNCGKKPSKCVRTLKSSNNLWVTRP